MKRIEKKWWSETFDLFASGRRKFELRLADFELAVGDIVVAREWNPKTQKYTGRTKEFKVKAVERSVKDPLKFWPIEKIREMGFLIIEFE
jgi:ASC-1-like (ASCH) protein